MRPLAELAGRIWAAEADEDMSRYLAIVDGGPGAYRVVIPDLPGVHGAGATLEQAIEEAVAVFPVWADAWERRGGIVPWPRDMNALLEDPEVLEQLSGSRRPFWAAIVLVRELGRSIQANLSIDAGILAAIDAEAARKKMTRSAMIELLAKVALPRLD